MEELRATAHAGLTPESFQHPPGAICVASGELSRYPSFTHAMLHVLRPTGTEIWMNCGLNVAANFNAGIRRMMVSPQLQWVWIMGDDHQFDSTTLLRLLDRQLDIVVPLVVRRQPPFIPVLFRKEESDTPLGQFPPYHWHQLPSTGLVEVYTAGSAGMLIRRNVLETLADPWFETGKMGKDLTNEDTYFCKKAQLAGFRIFADVDVQMDHWTPVSLRPVRTRQGTWTVGINLGNDIQVALPQDFLLEMVMTVKEESKESFGLEPNGKSREQLVQEGNSHLTEENVNA